MEHPIFKQRPRRHMWAVLVVSAVVIAGCGTSVPIAGGGPTTTAATATTERPTDTTAPSTTASSSLITVADLKALLPSAAQVGADYDIDAQADDDDDDDPEMDAAMGKACPEAKALLDDNAGDRPSADRSFSTEDDRSVDVKLEPGASLTSKAKDDVGLDELISAINDCDVISYTDKDGFHFEIKLQVRKDTDFGDLGIAMQMRMHLTSDDLPDPIEIHAGFRKFLIDDVGVSVSATSGIDQDTLKEIPADFEAIDLLSEQLEADVAALLQRN